MSKLATPTSMGQAQADSMERSTPPDTTTPARVAANTVVGDLTSYTEEQLSQSLRHIDATFTCKDCHMKKHTLKDLVEHLTGGHCKKQEVKTASADEMPKKHKRGRGRPKKTIKVEPLDSDDNEEVQMKMSQQMVTPTRRITRMATGSIKRKNAAELLGLNIKQEPEDSDMDVDSEYSPAKPTNTGHTHSEAHVVQTIKKWPFARPDMSEFEHLEDDQTQTEEPGNVSETDMNTEEDPLNTSPAETKSEDKGDIARTADENPEEETDVSVAESIQAALGNLTTALSLPACTKKQVRVFVVNKDPETGKTMEEHIMLTGRDDGTCDINEDTLKVIAQHIAKRAKGVKRIGDNSNYPVTVRVAAMVNPGDKDLKQGRDALIAKGDKRELKQSTDALVVQGGMDATQSTDTVVTFDNRDLTQGTDVLVAQGDKESAHGAHATVNPCDKESVQDTDYQQTETKSGAVTMVTTSQKQQTDFNTSQNPSPNKANYSKVKDEIQEDLDDGLKDAGEEDHIDSDTDYMPQLKTVSYASPRGRSPSQKTDGPSRKMGSRSQRKFRCPVCLVRYFSTETEYLLHMECHVYTDKHFGEVGGSVQDESSRIESTDAKENIDGKRPGSPVSPNIDKGSESDSIVKHDETASDIDEESEKLNISSEGDVIAEKVSHGNVTSGKPKVRLDHDKREFFQCPTCKFENFGWNRFLRHLLSHAVYRDQLKDSDIIRNIVGTFLCPICDKVFEKKSNMRAHWRKVHHKTMRVCEICNASLDGVDEKTFIRHVEKCKNVMMQCDLCNYSTRVSANMRRHMKIHVGQGHACEVCGKVFPTRQRCDVHKLKHQANRPKYPCGICQQDFCSLDAVKKHQARMHSNSPKKFQCDRCGYVARIKIDLTKHEKLVHHKKYQCPSCPFMTNSQTTYHQHQEFHGPDRIYPCPYSECYYRGATTKQLSNHVSQVHHVNSRHQCPVCQKYFKKKTHLLRHLVSHTGDKPYLCLDCGESFYSHSTYYRHRHKTGHDAKREGGASIPQNIMITYVDEKQIGAPENKEIIEEMPEVPLVHGMNGLEGMILQPGDMRQSSNSPELPDGALVLDGTGVGSMQTAQAVQTDDGQVVFIETSEAQFLEEIASGSRTVHKTADGITLVGEHVSMETEDQQSVTYITTNQDMDNKHMISKVTSLEGSTFQQVSHTSAATLGQNVIQIEGDNMVSFAENGLLQQNLVETTQESLQETLAEDSTGEYGTYILSEADAEALLNGQFPANMQIQAGGQSEAVDATGQEIVYQDVTTGDIQAVVEVAPPSGHGEQQYAILLMPPSAGGGSEPEAALSMLQLQHVQSAVQ